MDAKTGELRAAHDVLAEFYADRLADALDHMPAERAVLGLFCDLTLAAGLGSNVADVGCGTGRLEPYLAARGLSARGVDLSPEMIRVARRDHPGFGFDPADLRELPFEDASLAGAVCGFALEGPNGLCRKVARNLTTKPTAMPPQPNQQPPLSTVFTLLTAIPKVLPAAAGKS